MKKGKIIAVIISMCAIITAIVLCFCLNVFKDVTQKSGNDYSVITENMQAWTVSDTQGILLYIPDDYAQTENDFYSLYNKDDARIKLTYEEYDDSLDNYSYFAIKQYKDITDGFKIISESDELLGIDTTAHIIEFDYSLSLDSGVKNFSCLSAFVVANGKAYVLTCTCDGGNYSKYADDFHRTYKTLRAVSSSDESSSV